jgi:hypothetical protein
MAVGTGRTHVTFGQVRGKMRMGTLLLAALACLPLGVVAIGAFLSEVSHFRDPCFQWGEDGANSSGGFLSSARLRPVHPCATRSAGTNETKTGSVIRVMIVPGGILAAIAFGILGAARARPRLAVAGACLMLVEAVPLMFSIAPLAMVAAAALLVVAALSRRVPPRFAEGMLP